MNKKKLLLFVVLVIVVGAVLALSPRSRLTVSSNGFPEVHIKLLGWYRTCSEGENTQVYGWNESTQSFRTIGSIGPNMKGEDKASPYLLDDKYHPIGWCDYDSCGQIDFNIPLREFVYTGESESPVEDFNGIKGQHQRVPSYKTVPLVNKARVDIEYYRLPTCTGSKGYYSKVFNLDK